MGIRISGEYRFIAKDIRTGKETDLGTYHNIATNKFLECMAYGHKQSLYGSDPAINVMRFGSGTAEPSATDTAMGTQLWTIDLDAITNTAVSDDYLSVSKTFRCIVPASESYVGRITEVGLGASVGSYLLTHALLKDAESHPIYIDKTDVMQLTVLCTLTFTKTKNDLEFSLYSWYKYAFGNAIRILVGYSMGGSGHNTRIRLNGTRGEYLRKIGNTNVISTPRAYFTKDKSNIPSLWDSSTRKATISGLRALATEGNTHYVHSLGIGIDNNLQAFIHFPNERVFPKQTFEGMSVGAGDGETTDFKPPLNFWVKDTEEIFVNGTKLVRDVDYTCDYYNNLDNLEELYPSTQALIAGGYISSGSSTTRFYVSTTTMDREFSHNVTATPEVPLIVEFPMADDPALDWSIDRWTMRIMAGASKVNLQIYCSDDKENWESVFYITNLGTSDYTYNITKRTKKYWKFEVTGGTSISDNGVALKLYARRTGEMIHFTNPPALGAVITMNAQIDRPLKNSAHAIDFNPVIQF